MSGGFLSPEREAAMLHAIAETGARAPNALGGSPSALVITLAPADGDLERSWGDVGRTLTRLHSAGPADRSTTGGLATVPDAVNVPTAYHWPEDDAFGPLAIPNARLDDWPAFWAEHQLLAHVERLPPSK